MHKLEVELPLRPNDILSFQSAWMMLAANVNSLRLRDHGDNGLSAFRDFQGSNYSRAMFWSKRLYPFSTSWKRNHGLSIVHKVCDDGLLYSSLNASPTLRR